MGILKKMAQTEWEIARRKGRNKVVWTKGSAACVCSNVLLNNITSFSIGQAWAAIRHIGDPEYYVVENDSDVDESGEESEEYQ